MTLLNETLGDLVWVYTLARRYAEFDARRISFMKKKRGECSPFGTRLDGQTVSVDGSFPKLAYSVLSKTIVCG